MSGIFPNVNDGGLAPSDDPLNPTHAFPPNTSPVGTNALYYGNGCDVRLRPEVLNSLISEIAATADKADLAYNPAKLTNLQTAIRYLIQRGLPKGNLMTATSGQLDYQMTLDPRCTKLNDYMELAIVPNLPNLGAVRVSIDGLGFVPIVRNDGANLQMRDLVGGIPHNIKYYQGKFYIPYPVASQMPIIMTGPVDVWVRVDGNDNTGDGSANSADRAFRTINGAWRSVAARYSTSPIWPLNIRLGIPGNYESCSLGPYGGPVNLIGNNAARRDYRIVQTLDDPHYCVRAVSVNLTVNGVCLPMDYSSVNSWAMVAENGAALTGQEMEYEVNVNNANAKVWLMTAGGVMTLAGSHLLRGLGGTRTVSAIWHAVAGSTYWGGMVTNPGNITIQNIAAGAVVMSVDLSVVRFNTTTIASSGVTGPSWYVSGNSILNRYGQTVPGSGTGTIDSGGQVL